MFCSGFSETEEISVIRPDQEGSYGYVPDIMLGELSRGAGVELTELDAPKNFQHLTLAEASAHQASRPGRLMFGEAWMKSRQAMPDCRLSFVRAPGRKICISPSSTSVSGAILVPVQRNKHQPDRRLGQ